MIALGAMADVFVDLGYRGLSIAKRTKLAQVRPSTGYLETAAPMPVGSMIVIEIEDGIAIEASVVEVREVATSDRAPGMLVKPKLDGAAATWWKARVELPDLSKTTLPGVLATVVPKGRDRDDAAPELMDDGRNPAVTEIPVDAIAELGARDSNPNLLDDGKKTTMMDAIDLAALGLSSSSPSGQMPVVTGDEDSGGNGNGSSNGSSDRGSQPNVGKKPKRKRRPSSKSDT